MENHSRAEILKKDLIKLSEPIRASFEVLQKVASSMAPTLKQISEMNEDIEKIPKISESTLIMMHEAQESYRKISETINNLRPKIPSVNIPKISPIELNSQVIISAGANREKNEWQRHNEALKIQDSILKIQTGILEEQQSNTKLSRKIFWLTIIGMVITIGGIILDKIY